MHTSGLLAWLPLHSRYPDRASRIRAVMDTTPASAPGTTHLYSDLNPIALGVMVERLRGRSLDRVVTRRITRPLGMVDTGYNPDESKVSRIAATAYAPLAAGEQPQIIRGAVHDENARSLGGVAGHASVFSTADDMAQLAQALMNGGTYRGREILSRRSTELMITNFNDNFPGNARGSASNSTGVWYMAGLASLRTAGHTGFTGPGLVIDVQSRSFLVFLANRIHPSRSWGSNNALRRAAAQGLALALAVGPAKGRRAWFTGTADATTSTLTTAIAAPSGAALTFATFVDTEATDKLYLERSSDGSGRWTPVPFRLSTRYRSLATDGSFGERGLRQWQRATASLPAGEYQLRWRVPTDGTHLGRGVYVDDVLVADAAGRVLLDGEKEPERLGADGWRVSTR